MFASHSTGFGQTKFYRRSWRSIQETPTFSDMSRPDWVGVRFERLADLSKQAYKEQMRTFTKHHHHHPRLVAVSLWFGALLSEKTI